MKNKKKIKTKLIEKTYLTAFSNTRNGFAREKRERPSTFPANEAKVRKHNSAPP